MLWYNVADFQNNEMIKQYIKQPQLVAFKQNEHNYSGKRTQVSLLITDIYIQNIHLLML